MKRIAKKDYLVHKLVFMIIEYILPIISGILLTSSVALQYGVRKHMGLQRDLVYRNRLLTDTILSSSKLNIYQWIVVIGLVFSLIIYFKQKRKYSQYSTAFRSNIWEKKLKKCVILIRFISIVWLIVVFYYSKATWLAYPWIVLTTLIVIIVQYIRLAYLYCQIVSPRD